MATLQDVILNNSWKSSTFNESTDVNRLFNSGIVTAASAQAQAMINAVEYDNVQSTIKVGMLDFTWTEQNFGDASATVAPVRYPNFDEMDGKIFYGNSWWGIATIQRDLMNSTAPLRLVLEFVGRYWATQFNRIISATVSGMSDITDITVGDGTTNLSRTMVIEARKQKGDMGFGKLANMYMSSTTISDILTKQEAGTISRELITEKYGTVSINKDGVTQVVQSDTPEYVYGGATKVVVDDSMNDGIISLVEERAFAFAQRDLAQPLMYDSQPSAGNGVGREQWGSKMLYILHPVGFSFNGVEGTSFASRSGLTIAELKNGSQYELKVDAKLSPITNLRVKIG